MLYKMLYSRMLQRRLVHCTIINFVLHWMAFKLIAVLGRTVCSIPSHGRDIRLKSKRRGIWRTLVFVITQQREKSCRLEIWRACGELTTRAFRFHAAANLCDLMRTFACSFLLDHHLAGETVRRLFWSHYMAVTKKRTEIKSIKSELQLQLYRFHCTIR